MSNTVNNYTETDLGNVSLNPRGEYDSSAEYEYLDTVSYQGGSYFCRAELETTITGIAPDAGHNSEHWQMIAAPGDMTPEYTTAYNDVINKAVQVESSRAAVELAQQEIEAVQTDVQQLHSDTAQTAQEAENSKNSAANSAQSAEQSKNAASESEQNVNNTLVAFDDHVEGKKNEADAAINKTKDAAIKAVTDQQSTSVQAVKDQTAPYIAEKEISAKTEIGNYTSEKIAEINKKASEANITLANTITDGNSLKTQLETTISTADTSKKNLDASNTAATKTKADLDTSNTTATKTKADLDTSNTTASETKTGLDATNKTAAGLVTSLGDKIAEGTQVKNDIQTTGETAMSNLQAEAAKQQEYIKASIDDTLSISRKAADAAVTGKKISLLKEDVSNKITKFYASNQGETHLADSDNGKIMDMMLYGRSEQKQYRGKNLLPTTMYSDSNVMNGVTFINNGDGSVTVSGTATDTTYFTLWGYNALGDKGVLQGITPGDVLYVSDCFLQQSNSKEVISTISNGTAQFEDSTATMYVAIKVEKGKTVNKTYYPQIEKGSEFTSYEPYVGGQPSPSPDYPQEIKSVVNPTVKVIGENFYPGSDLIGLTKAYVTDFMPVILHKGKIYISFDAFSDASNGNYLINALYFDANKEQIGSNGSANEIGNNISHVSLVFDGSAAGRNYEDLNLQNIPYVKITFNIYGTTATEITYKNIMISATDSDFEPYKPVQTVTIPYTLNAIPANSGGNVTIDGQQYIADYVDVERGKLVRMCERTTFNTKNGEINEEYRLAIDVDIAAQNNGSKECIFSAFEWTGWGTCAAGTKIYIKNIKKSNNELYTARELKELGLDFDAIYQLAEKQEIDLTTEQITAFKELVTYYPVTNVSVNSEQLDGYTVFNYPISMANGWNYVKKQLNDNRDYIYDMDTQSAEAYVNSEYAVALTELEV